LTQWKNSDSVAHDDGKTLMGKLHPNTPGVYPHFAPPVHLARGAASRAIKLSGRGRGGSGRDARSPEPSRGAAPGGRLDTAGMGDVTSYVSDGREGGAGRSRRAGRHERSPSLALPRTLTGSGGPKRPAYRGPLPDTSLVLIGSYQERPLIYR